MKIRLLIGCLVLALLGASPYLTGWIVKYELSNFINKLDLPQGLSLKVERYAIRYARSWVQVKVIADETLMEQPHVSYIRMKIFHGPIFPTETNTLALGLARAHIYAKADDLAPANARLQDSIENFFEKNEILSGNATINFLGNIEATLSTAPAYYKSEEGLLSFEGITAHITSSYNMNRLTFDMNVSPLLLEGKNEAMLDMAAATVHSDGTRSRNTPWIGSQSLSLPSFYLRDEKGQTIRFSEFNLKTQSGIEQNLVNILVEATAKDIEFFNEKFGNASLALKLNRLDPKGLVDFSRITQDNPNNLTEMEWQDARHVALVDVLKNGASGSFTHSMTPEAGNVSFNASIDFPNVFNTENEKASINELTQQLILKMKASVSLHAPLTWLEHALYQVTLPYLPADAAVYTDPKTQKTIPAQEALKLDITGQFKALNDSQILITREGQSSFDFRYDAGNLFMNEKPLTQEDLAKLMSIFEP